MPRKKLTLDQINVKNLGYAVAAYYSFQKNRLANEGRIRNIEINKYNEKLIDIMNLAQRGEDEIRKEITERVQEHVMFEPLAEIPGIGPVLSAGIISYIEAMKNKDVGKRGIAGVPLVTKLWRFAGMGVVNGHAERLTKGEVNHYAKKFKVLCFRIGDSFVNAKGPYQKLYRESRKAYDAKWRNGCHTPAHKKRCSKGHKFMAAKRRTVKIFLHQVWQYWRKSLGLPTPELYSIAILKHTKKLHLPPLFD